MSKTKDVAEAVEIELPERESAPRSSHCSADSIVMWTEAYRPFRMGGDVNQPVGVKVHVTEPVSVGHGLSVYVVITPDDRTAIVELTTGAIVGNSLDRVRADVQSGDPQIMAEQVSRAAARREDVEVLSPDEFFAIWKAA